ncbi:MAG: helicase HerA-like domain-containing protein [Bacteroidales bacterium]
MQDSNGFPLIGIGERQISFYPKMMNRHGLITGATGTGKTISLQVMAEAFSSMGVPVFLADVKGDMGGMCLAGGTTPKVVENVQKFELADFTAQGFPVVFWDIFGEKGHPLRTTISEMGPLLLSRLLKLNDVQYGVLNLTFKIADDNGLLLLDLADLRAMLEFTNTNRDKFTQYGNITTASIGAIQRGLLILEEQGANNFFGEPALNIYDLIQTSDGKGVVNILSSDKLIQSPALYSTFLLWLLSELFEELPEVGDLEKPKLVFFFDEAHLLFNEAPPVLLEKIEQVVRLIRSKGVGIYFISQNPLDIPEMVLGQLGNRIQHALRAYTPRDQKAVATAASTFRPNPKLDTERVITELGVGEALVSFLDPKGIPGMVERAFIVPPQSQIGPITEQQRQQQIQSDILFGSYEKAIDRDSAFEVLQRRMQQASVEMQREEGQQEKKTQENPMGGVFGDLAKAAGTTVVRTISSEIGRQLVRGLLGGIFGGKKSRR